MGRLTEIVDEIRSLLPESLGDQLIQINKEMAAEKKQREQLKIRGHSERKDIKKRLPPGSFAKAPTGSTRLKVTGPQVTPTASNKKPFTMHPELAGRKPMRAGDKGY